MPTHLLQLFEDRTFSSLHDMLAVLAEKSGILNYSHAGAYLYRQNSEVPKHVAWVNIEVPPHLAVGVSNRYERMYPVATQVEDQNDVLDLHPWVTSGIDTLGPRSLTLSQIMDHWKSDVESNAHYFVIDLNGDCKLERDDLWSHYFDHGYMVYIFKENGRFLLRHVTLGSVDLLETYGADKRFWIENWLSLRWHGRVGYYVGIEAVTQGMTRIWAALSPDAPLSALANIQGLCHIVHFPECVSAIERIPGATDTRLKRRLYIDHGGSWHVEYRGQPLALPGDVAWIYVHYLLYHSAKFFTEQELYQERGRPLTTNPDESNRVEFERSRSGGLRSTGGGVSQQEIAAVGLHSTGGVSSKSRPYSNRLIEEVRKFLRYADLYETLGRLEKSGEGVVGHREKEEKRLVTEEIQDLLRENPSFEGKEEGKARQKMINALLAKANREVTHDGGEVGSVAKALQRVRTDKNANPDKEFREYLRERLTHAGDSWMHLGDNWDE
jgi:hypothetical protein